MYYAYLKTKCSVKHSDLRRKDEVIEQLGILLIFLTKSFLYRSCSVVKTVQSRRLQWAGHIARLGRRGMHTEC
jgi:hypothetical protein